MRLEQSRSHLRMLTPHFKTLIEEEKETLTCHSRESGNPPSCPKMDTRLRGYDIRKNSAERTEFARKNPQRPPRALRLRF
jgi:hypothetical protein